MSHIFISYSRANIDFARYLRALLENEQFYVWLDEARIASGSRWWNDIEKNIDACAAMIVIMSPEAKTSDWVEREILRGENQKKPIFPVLLAGDPWSRLANLQFVDLRAGLRATLPPTFVKTLRRAGLPEAPAKTINFTIQQGDILAYEADVVALKHAQKFYGADLKVLDALSVVGIAEDTLAPAVGDYRYVKTEGGIVAPYLLSVGTQLLREVGYKELREFAARCLSALAEVAPQTQHLAMTIHGPGFGLDELEALRSQFAGYLDALNAGDYPPALRQITIVEFNEDRLERLRTAMDTDFAMNPNATPLKNDWGYDLRFGVDEPIAPVRPIKPHIFVVIPPEEDLDDVFYFGIQGPAHALGLLCERIEAKMLTDELLEQARQRIDTAAVVIITLTRPDPHVYLQMGYAWGKGRPTILLARDAKVFEFETTGGSRLVYTSLKNLEAGLSKTLNHMKGKGLLA